MLYLQSMYQSLVTVTPHDSGKTTDETTTAMHLGSATGGAQKTNAIPWKSGHVLPFIGVMYQTAPLQVKQRSMRMSLHIFHYLLTYLLTPWSRVLLEKLTVLQLVNKFPAFYRTRKLNTVLKSARQLSLSCANSIQSPQTPPTS